jgi:hypothetical protein
MVTDLFPFRFCTLSIVQYLKMQYLYPILLFYYFWFKKYFWYLLEKNLSQTYTAYGVI